MSDFKITGEVKSFWSKCYPFGGVEPEIRGTLEDLRSKTYEGNTFEVAKYIWHPEKELGQYAYKHLMSNDKCVLTLMTWMDSIKPMTLEMKYAVTAVASNIKLNFIKSLDERKICIKGDNLTLVVLHEPNFIEIFFHPNGLRESRSFWSSKFRPWMDSDDVSIDARTFDSNDSEMLSKLQKEAVGLFQVFWDALDHVSEDLDPDLYTLSMRYLT